MRKLVLPSRRLGWQPRFAYSLNQRFLGMSLALVLGLILGSTAERPIRAYRARNPQRLAHPPRSASQGRPTPVLGIQS